MALNKPPEFMGECAHPMMFRLTGNVRSNLCDIGFRNGKSAVASAPRKFFRQNVIRVDPVGRTSLQQLDQLLD